MAAANPTGLEDGKGTEVNKVFSITSCRADVGGETLTLECTDLRTLRRCFADASPCPWKALLRWLRSCSWLLMPRCVCIAGCRCHRRSVRARTDRMTEGAGLRVFEGSATVCLAFAPTEVLEVMQMVSQGAKM